jgi:hypothetical protein
MQKLTRADLISLEQYAVDRKRMRTEVIAHKLIRNVQVGPNMTWCFEDRITIRYQIQEMLRVERIFESAGIQEELDAYNPLIPDGTNFKATMLIEYPDADVRRAALEKLKDVENRCWMQVNDMERIFATADEDLERSNDEKTSAVHFLRFELSPAMVGAFKSGAPVGVGVDHENYRHSISPLPPEVRDSLRADLG